jgi:hypothetical protein
MVRRRVGIPFGKEMMGRPGRLPSDSHPQLEGLEGRIRPDSLGDLWMVPEWRRK